MQLINGAGCIANDKVSLLFTVSLSTANALQLHTFILIHKVTKKTSVRQLNPLVFFVAKNDKGRLLMYTKILVILSLIITIVTTILPTKVMAENRHFRHHWHCCKRHCWHKKPPINVQIAQQEFIDNETKGAN